MGSWVRMLVQPASSDSASLHGDSSGSGSSDSAGFGGHALLAIKAGPVYEVFHLVGARNSLSGTGHNVYNASSSVERYRSVNNQNRSVGGRSGRTWNEGSRLANQDWYRQSSRTSNMRQTGTFPLKKEVAQKLIDRCLDQCRQPDRLSAFSLAGANVRLGTNCVTWVYDMLRSVRVTFDWKLYLMSFVSPRKAVESGGRLQHM